MPSFAHEKDMFMLHLIRSTARRCGKRDLACSGRAFVNFYSLKRRLQKKGGH